MRTNRLILALSFPLLLIATSATAQRWSWPEKLENMQVLPSDWTGDRLQPVMKGFTRALGVRCSHCHVGEEGKPLSTYDFVSDANPNKDRARAMLRMLKTIGGELKKLEPSGDHRVNMWCDTCHRGRPRPMTLADELAEVYRGSDATKTLAYYEDIKSRFYGKGAYLFDDKALNAPGYEALANDDVEGAIEILRANTVEYPESANAWDSYGEALMRAGRLEEAKTGYERSLELNPRNDNARKMLEEISSRKE